MILGGSGFLSSELARRAVARGLEVWTVTRGYQPLPEGVHSLRVDRNNPTSLEEAVRSSGGRWTLVVDCIGKEERHTKQDVEIFQSCADHLVFVSSTSVYDPGKQVLPWPTTGDLYYDDDGEELDKSSMSFWKWYAISKRRAERAIINGDTGSMEWTIIRPTHIYGPGSYLGCLPFAFRDPELIYKLRTGETLQIVGNGHFLQQPIFVSDLADLILSMAGNENVFKQVYNGTGPEIIESRRYYELIGEALGVPVRIQENSVSEYLTTHPAEENYICHRIFNTDNLKASGVHMPSTPVAEGLLMHVNSLLQDDKTK